MTKRRMIGIWARSGETVELRCSRQFVRRLISALNDVGDVSLLDGTVVVSGPLVITLETWMKDDEVQVTVPVGEEFIKNLVAEK